MDDEQLVAREHLRAALAMHLLVHEHLPGEEKFAYHTKHLRRLLDELGADDFDQVAIAPERELERYDGRRKLAPAATAPVTAVAIARPRVVRSQPRTRAARRRRHTSRARAAPGREPPEPEPARRRPSLRGGRR